MILNISENNGTGSGHQDMAAGNRRRMLLGLWQEALKAVDPGILVARQAETVRSVYLRGGYQRLLVIGFGKAAGPMALALEQELPELITAGLVVSKYGHLANAPARLEAHEAGHPIPDENGLLATARIMALLAGADDRTQVVNLISGGGSALLVAPGVGLSLADKQQVTAGLLKAGADINEMNAVRKHLSQIKGGRAAALAWPAGSLSLIVSDVLGDRLDVIASGPFAPDPTTFGYALAVLGRYGLKETVPAQVLAILEQGARGRLPETPKAGAPIFDRVENLIIGNNRLALNAAVAQAEALGATAVILADSLQGEARTAGAWLAEKAKAVQAGRPSGPVCLISGGETTVTVRGQGRGGRNMELALAFAIRIAGQTGITLLSAGTDGTDGPTEAAGAVVDGQTVEAARNQGLDPEQALRDNDSYSFFKQSGDLLVTGPTGTNVMDIQLILVGGQQQSVDGSCLTTG